MKKKTETVLCRTCGIKVNAEVLAKDLTHTLYKCENVDKDGNPHNFAIHNLFGHIVKGGKAIGSLLATLVSIIIITRRK